MATMSGSDTDDVGLVFTAKIAYRLIHKAGG
jgi:hypothetical protein